MNSDLQQLRTLITGMRAAYLRGENAMAYARKTLDATTEGANEIVATLIAYDLQTGTYVSAARRDPDFNWRWCAQLGGIIAGVADAGSSILEVGCGEATTLTGVLQTLGRRDGPAFGFDISWSRVAEGRKWLEEKEVAARLFVGDLFSIPFEDDSIDVVYTAHSIEPNGGREVEAISELMRVARRWVVLVEPCHELAPEAARKRMQEHRYVRNLRQAAERCGAGVVEHRLLEVMANPLNPSGLLLLEKKSIQTSEKREPAWECPISKTPLRDLCDAFVSAETGLAYPVLRGIPMLRPENAIVASHLDGLPGEGHSLGVLRPASR